MTSSPDPAIIRHRRQKDDVALPRFRFADRDAAYAFFEQNGCVIFSDVVSVAQIDDVKREIGSVISQQVDKHLEPQQPLREGFGFDRGLIELAEFDDELRRRLYESLQNLPSLYRILTGSRFFEIIGDLGVEKPSPYVQLRLDLPGDERFLIPPHQEISAIKSPNFRFMIVPLADTPREGGALSAALGSHKLGPIVPESDPDFRYQYVDPRKYEEQYPLRQIPMVAGEALVLDKLLIHGSTENTSSQVRWSTILRSEDLANMPYLDGDDSHANYTRKAL